MLCPQCSNENEPGRKFCGECGSPLSVLCAQCGSANTPGIKFCGECGASLAPAPAPAAREAPASERRLVSVLFADLVGFTTLSESRDSEEVRELLTRYFDTCRRLIERYGGTVEKFIGDAVMAVWGTPVAQEDDAERAVRAALDLVQAVPELDPNLQARAGVLTGEAAVTIGAEGQGMVAGDLVNTASRIQSVAEAGTVLVGDSTKRSSEAAIAYEDAGSHELKGKAEPVPLSRALRVVAGAGGAMRSSGLEAPFVGRDRELRLVKELFHGSADEKKAQLVSVTGIAGIGKTRLSWEFEKYADGLAENVWWHRGRCLSYGEGVAYWALSEMVRMRAGISEDEEPQSARVKLHATIEEHIGDAEERSWVEPRLAHLLGLEEGAAGDQENLFSAWRILFERLAERAPTILVFEDMQWADAGLLDFLEYLLEWSRSHPLFVLALARPELTDKRPSWGAGKRNFTSLYLEPLSPQAMGDLLAGLVPGLPDDLRDRILDRAEGVPLYAVETVRMLLDRGLLVQDGSVYRPTGPVETLEVPETLHALIAARLDSLSSEERRLVQNGAVLGKTFTRHGLTAVTGLSDGALEPLLAGLLRKEILSIQADPRSPERGQYSFLQDIVKHVAYETISKKERKAKHLQAAQFLSSVWSAEEDEIVEVVAAHYLDAYTAAPDDADAEEIRSQAREMLVRAGERAASLAANADAQRSFERAAELTDDRLVQATLLERAGRMAWAAGRGDAATRHLVQAIEYFDAEGQTHATARVSARLGEITWAGGHIDQAIERMEASFSILSKDDPDEDLAVLAAQLGRLLFFMGEPDRAAERIEQALEMAEALWLPEVLSQALNTKGIVLEAQGRPEECLGLLRHALQVALENDVPSAALRAYYNLSNSLYYRDRHDGCLQYARDGLALARRLGDRTWEWNLLEQMVSVLFLTGSWNEALERAEEIPHREDFATHFSAVETLVTIPQLLVARGQVEDANDTLVQFASFGESADVQERTAYQAISATVLRGQSRLAEALSSGLAAFDERGALGAMHPNIKLGFVEAVEAAFELGDFEKIDELLAVVRDFRAGDNTPSLRAQAARFRARLASARGEHDAVEQAFKAAAQIFREHGIPFWFAVVQLEHGEWLTAQGRSDEADPLLAEAHEIFERLEAKPWLERLTRIGAPTEVPA